MLKLVVAKTITLREVAENDTRQNRELVKELQKNLQKKGYYMGLVVDGWFGPETKSAVQDFQRDNGMKVTGMADEALRKKLTSR
jgi:peptidoglycan hydrolase-like protein with peptidoglycan-binding domain